MKMKKILALWAAVTMLGCMTVTAHADTLEERDGLKYRISDSGEDMGLYSGWTEKGGKRYYYMNGEMKKNCWIMSGGERKYYLTPEGTAATGKLTVGGVEYEFDGKGAIVPDEWGLTLTAKDVTPGGCTVVFTQSGGKPAGRLTSGHGYSLECYENGEWTEAEMLPQENEVAWAMEALWIEENDSVEFDHRWQWLYGDLAPGKYRICKDVDARRATDYDTKKYCAYFEIE